MEDVVKNHNGGIVKTIGDAIMAVFVNPSDAVKSAFEMIKKFDEFNLENKSKDSIIIKVGIHFGHCIAVTLNDRIDYFGTTVNISVRVQGLSDGRDIFISDNIYEESSAAEMIKGKKWNSESLVTSLKGLKNNYKIHKLTKSD